MIRIKYIVFRNLTQADFFNINKPRGSETGGGGQSYIDFPVDAISVDQWKKFFDNGSVVTSQRAHGPCWTFTIKSLGTTKDQTVKFYQRRPQSVSIAGQKIQSARSNRVLAWHPDHGFPSPKDPSNRASLTERLCIFVIRSFEDEYWAGWFSGDNYYFNTEEENPITSMLNNSDFGHSDFISLENVHVEIDESFTSRFVFAGSDINGSIDSTTNELEDDFLKDTGDIDESNPEINEAVVKIRKRNKKITIALKKLYHCQCQISGNQYTFIKADGFPYCEAHHLIPLGKEGADHPENLIIVSPLIHRMLHYAKVEGIDLSKIDDNNTLTILINDKPYTITWDQRHRDFFRT